MQHSSKLGMNKQTLTFNQVELLQPEKTQMTENSRIFSALAPFKNNVAEIIAIDAVNLNQNEYGQVITASLRINGPYTVIKDIRPAPFFNTREKNYCIDLPRREQEPRAYNVPEIIYSVNDYFTNDIRADERIHETRLFSG